jgi:hypothetical protein
MAYLKPKCKKKVPNNLSFESGNNAGVVDIYAEQFAEEDQIEVTIKLDSLWLDDPKDLRKLARWCEEVATYLEKYTTGPSI